MRQEHMHSRTRALLQARHRLGVSPQGHISCAKLRRPAVQQVDARSARRACLKWRGLRQAGSVG